MAKIFVLGLSVAGFGPLVTRHFPHQVTVSGPGNDERIEWCTEMIGECGRRTDDKSAMYVESDAGWCYLLEFWYFKKIDDAVMFRTVFG